MGEDGHYVVYHRWKDSITRTCHYKTAPEALTKYNEVTKELTVKAWVVDLKNERTIADNRPTPRKRRGRKSA